MNDDPTTFSTVMEMVMHAEAERARQEERAAVVAWLRREMQPCSGPVRATLAFSANSIEEGKHRREEGA